MKIPSFVYIIIGLLISGFSRYIEKGGSERHFIIFFYAGLVFFLIGVVKAVIGVNKREKVGRREKAKSSKYCSKCGTVLGAIDNFCWKCGSRLLGR